MEKEFIVLYTHQKQKKAKTWHDGVLKASCHNKKATLYDEKGSRLDSIYIKAGDITLGEQLESDRYYILVEDVKKVAAQDGAVQQKSQNGSEERTQPSMSSSDRRPVLLSSQGKCSGLKKKSFVPPRMNKMPRQDLDESSQLSQNIELEIDSQIGQTFSQYSRSNLIHSDKLEILNSRGYQRQHQGNFSSLSMYQGGQKKDDDSMDTNLQNPNESNLIGRNLNSMASPIADYMNQLKKVCFDSQDSNGSNRIKSPWSVYGSNNNSPKTLNSPRNEGIGRTDLKAVVTEPDNGAEHSVNNSDQLKCRSTQEQTLQDLDSFHNDKLEEGKADKYDCVTESNNEDFSELTDRHHKVVNENTKNEFQSKRSMLEIMKLVKGKTALFGTNRKESDNKMQEKSRALRCNERVLNEEQIDSNSVDHENENVIETNNLRIDSYKINDKSELLSNTPHSSTHEEVTAIDLDSCELSPTERLDMDVCPSFAISFSPLSNVTYSDDESVQEDKIASKCVIDNTATVKSVDTSEVNEVSNSTVSNHVKWLMPDALHQRVKQNKSDIDSHTNFPNDNIVNEDENAFKNENDSLTLSAQCDKITPEDRKESPGNDNHVHSSSGEGDGLLSKKEINDTPKEFSDPTNDQEEKSSYEAEDIVQNRIQGKCSVQVDRNNKKENSDTETIGQDESNENIGQCLDGISSVKNADETMTQFVGSINGTVETAENLKESLFENEIPKSDITEESDFIDLIDNAECNNALETEIFDCNSVVSDKTVSGVSDRKTTQSQDTMEYSCDTMSHCSDSQLFLQSQPLEVPDIAKFKSLDKSNIILPIQQTRKSEEFKSSFESQEVSQQIPLGSTYIGLGQKLQSQNVSPSLSKGAYVKDNIEKYPIIQCDRDCVKPKLRHNKELPHDRDSEPLKSHDLSSEENIQRPHFIDCDPHQEAEPECESILTQIDNHHTVNMYERSANSGHQRVKRWKNLDTITDWQMNNVNLPVSEFPHPSELFGRKVRKKIKECESSVDPVVRGRENIPPEIGVQTAELSDKINEKFKGYKFSGSLCSQVSRDPTYNRTQWMSQETFSPNQQLSDNEVDGVVSIERSPSLFGDDGDRPSTLAQKFKEGKCVFISESESSKGNTPQLPGQDCDDDYIYSQIYRARPMIQDKGLVMQGDEAASPETFGQTAPHILDENINSSVNVTPVHCRDFQYDESPPELFTQPRNMFDKQNRVYGGLQLYREKQRAALWSEPINDQVTHDNYQNSNCPNVKCDSDQIPFKFNEKRTFAENVNEIHGNIFDNSQDSTFGYVKTGSSDVNLGVRRNTDLGKFVNRPFSGHENHNFICDNNEFARTSNDALFTKETHFSDDLSLSSQEFAAVINKNLIPKNEQTTSATQKNINSSSKWEKYYSQQSEEDLHLDIDALKVKVKDFSVIEKPFKTDNVIFPRNQIDISTQHTNIINNRTNVDKRLFPQLPPVKEDTTVSKVMCTNTATQISRLDNSKLPSSFSSMDSFEQMLANDNLDFSDPELDKLLQTQTNVDKIEGELISESPGSNPNEKFSVANASDMQNDAQWDHKQGEKCSRQKLSPEENEYPNGSCGEIEHQSGSCKEVELDFTPCDKDETNLVENSMAAKPHENIDSMQAVECDTKIADTCDKKTVENCDIKFPDINDRHFEAHNETHAGVKSLSESEISFSLDDSFVTSIQLNVKASTETKKRPAVSLRAPWKENTNSNSVIENVIKSPVSALKRPIANESRIGVGYKEDHQSAIIDTDKMNIESSDNVRLDVVENKPCNMRINFMGYDSEDDDLPSGEEVAIPEKTEVRQNERENAFSENPQNKKSNMFTNSNSSQLKTDTQDKPNPSLSSLKAGTGSVSTPFKNPFKNGEMTQKRTANQGNRVTKRFVPPLQQRHHSMTPTTKSYSPPSSRSTVHKQTAGDLQAEVFSRSMCGELLFPSLIHVQSAGSLVRQVTIPTMFRSAAEYKNILTAAVTEYLNLQLCDLAKKYHHALSKVDVSQLEGSHQDASRSGPKSKTPACQCGAPAKVVQVKKQGPNNGRFFYACSGVRNQQCKFFQWLDEAGKGGYVGGRHKISDPHALITHMKNQRLQFYSECSLVSKYRESIKDKFIPKYARPEAMQKKQLYLKLSHKGQSSLYSKDDIWVVSQSLDFSSKHTFIARSTYFGPTSSNEVEIDPVVGYSPSNWSKDTVCHALLVGNASTELSCLDNIKDHLSPQSPPVIPSLLNREVRGIIPTSGYQAPRMITETNRGRNIYVHSEEIDDLVRAYIEDYHLNEDQAEAIKRVGSMFSVEKSDNTDSVLLIHGVFGAGKSFLLSVIVLFLVKVFQRNDLASPRELFPWKLLISSTTNVAVDRILQGLLELGFEDFIRVGSVKKIAKPILPYSVHGTGTDSQELRDFQEMLRSGELTVAEKQNVRQGIDKLRKGENKKKLAGVRVVGVTCASCLAACISNMQFPVVLLDECSQMTEPSSLLPIARFGCEKLLLVGDPKQLDPTIQGSEAANENGLEQTLFDRLIKMGYIPTLLRTQYRCHPDISAASNKLFYSGMLIDGITAEHRAQLLLPSDQPEEEIKPELPTICMYDVDRGQECCEMAGSFYNEQEAQFVVFLIQFLMSYDIEPSSVGVITLYRSQMARITDLLNTGLAGENKEIKGVQVSTVDAFQGGERDIIILSTVRTHASGFIDNDKRTNVALTRARHHLLIVGHYGNLSRNLLWQKILNHCRGFQNGIQSSDEARQQLESVLERLKEENLHQNEEINSSKTSQENKLETKKRKPAAKRRQKKNESLETTPALSCPSGSLDREVPGGESVSEPLTGKRKRKRNKGEESESPQFSLSHSSGDSLPVTSETALGAKTKSSRKKSRLSDRLKPELFGDDTKDSSDDDLIQFSL